MSKQDEPERRFVLERKPIMTDLREPEQPNLVVGADKSVMSFFGDILRWIDRRRAAKKRAKDHSGT
jgi:hypothetical protein